MGRIRTLEKDRKQTRKSLILTIITIILFVILSLLILNNYQIFKSELHKNTELKNKIKTIKESNTNEEDINNNLSLKFNEIDNIDASIMNEKNKVFELAKNLENKIVNKETNYKIAYITFDDGPYHLTDNVLEILKKYEIKATFFTIGLDKDTCYDNPNYSCKETYKKIVDNGHTIANHTYSHAIFRGLYNSSDSFINQVKLQEKLIEERTGIKTNIIRFPGGSATANALAKNSVNSIMQELKNNHYGWVDWTAQDGDGGYLPSSDLAWNNFINTIDENIEVILFHDYSYQTISILPKVIEYLQEKNYILLPLFYDSIKVNK